VFACEHAGITPDMICLSKALTAGYLPLAATVVTDAIYDAFLSDDRALTFFHGHSFTANPLACAVALASLDLFDERDVLGDVGRLERQLRAGLAPLRDLPRVGDVRVMGGVGAVELVSSQGSGDDPYLDGIGPRLTAAFLERGLLLRPLGTVLYFMPPYVITPAEVDWVMAQIAEVLAESLP
jgi:adenosylmethionine-8-amino-7-oxononanoate aminotransferase